MQPIEIRFHRKILTAFIVAIVSFMIGMSYYIFVYNSFASSQYMKVLYLVMDAYCIYSIYKLGKRLSKNDPVLTISKNEIIINDGSSEQTYKWSDIQEIAISKDDDSWQLTLRTFYEEKKVSLNWLEKSPEQIKELIDEYRSKATGNTSFTVNKQIGT